MIVTTAPADAASVTVTEHRYGARTDQLLSLYEPARDSDALVVAVHGGAWRTGDRALMASVAEGLSERGHAVASIEYRMGAADPAADMLADVADALVWARRQHSGRVIVLGDSAGAHVALLAALKATHAGDPAPDGVVSLCGALALDELTRPSGAEQERRFAEYVQTLTAGGAAPWLLSDHDPLRVRASLEKAPPALLAVTSAYDFFARSTLAYATAALSRGDTVTVHSYGREHPSCTHSWQLDRSLVETTGLLDQISSWIGRS